MEKQLGSSILFTFHVGICELFYVYFRMPLRIMRSSTYTACVATIVPHRSRCTGREMIYVRDLKQ
jgi:hypothetical protein